MVAQENHVAKRMAEALAFMCLNNHFRQPLHSGHDPVSRTGDYTDVMITDAKGRRMPWCQVSRVSSLERKKMMEDVANAIYDFLLNIETENYAGRLEDAYHASIRWKKADSVSEKKNRH